MKTIALANQKGGVGKTTTAASLGIGLSRQGKKVLLIDADAQGNLTQMLGWPQPDELSPTLSTLMEKIIAEQPITPGEGILHHQSGIHLVPANIELSALEVTLVNTMSRETVLRQYLSTVADRYDYALIDCMPSLGISKTLSYGIKRSGLGTGSRKAQNPTKPVTTRSYSPFVWVGAFCLWGSIQRTKPI